VKFGTELSQQYLKIPCEMRLINQQLQSQIRCEFLRLCPTNLT